MESVIIYHGDLVQSQSMLKKLKTQTYARSIVSDSLEVISVLALSGAGVAILPTRVVQVLAPQLRKIPDMPTFRDEIYFLYRADLQKSGGAKSIIGKIKSIKI